MWFRSGTTHPSMEFIDTKSWFVWSAALHNFFLLITDDEDNIISIEIGLVCRCLQKYFYI